MYIWIHKPFQISLIAGENAHSELTEFKRLGDDISPKLGVPF